MTDIGKKMGRSEQRGTNASGETRKAIKTKHPAGRRVKMHTHTEEEAGYLISGHIVLTIGGTDYEMHGGDVWKIPGGVPHGARVIEDSITVEIIPAVRSEKA